MRWSPPLFIVPTAEAKISCVTVDPLRESRNSAVRHVSGKAVTIRGPMPPQKNVGKKSCEPLKSEAVYEELKEHVQSHVLQCSPGEKKAEKLPELSATLLTPDTNDPEAPVLELDELCSLVLKKTNKAWSWIALCRKTRQVVAYAIGERSEKTCRILWEAIPEA